MDFADHERPRHLAASLRVADGDLQATLRCLKNEGLRVIPDAVGPGTQRSNHEAQAVFPADLPDLPEIRPHLTVNATRL